MSNADNGVDLTLERRDVFGSDVLFLHGVRLKKFPVQRPVEKPVWVFSDAGVYLGQGVGSDCPRTGGCIKINGKKYDSNQSLLWQYV